MPSAFNWAQIESGATFHALVGVVLETEDPDVVVFNREGPDGAIDAVSGDRRTVFQSKHHKSAIWTRAISDAKAELEKIRDYR